MILLKAYLDESGHASGPFCVVSGFVGTESQWEAFENDWKHATSPRQSFHLRRLRWNSKPERLKALLKRTGDLPDKHGLARIAASVNRADYEAYTNGAKQHPSKSPYMMCLMHVIIKALSSMAPNQQIFFFFENQEKYKSELASFHDEIFVNRKHDARVIGCGYLRKDQCRLFEPADYLSFHLAHRFANVNSYKSVATLPIWGNGAGIGIHLAGEHLRAILNPE